MKTWWRLRRATAEVAPLLVPGNYLLAGDTASRLTDDKAFGRLPNPRRMRVATEQDGTPEHDTLIRRSDCLILLATDRGHVTRLYRDPEKTERLVANSHWLRSAFPCPGAEPLACSLPGFHGVREEFVSGRMLRDAEPTQWRPVYREFLRCCADHARHCAGHVEPSPWFAELDRWTLSGNVGAALERWRDELAEVLNGTPRLLSHGDAHNGNLMVTDSGELAVIDVERVEDQPFFFDALSIPRGSEAVNRTLRREYLDGAFDNELAAIWHAAGQSFQPERRAAYLLAVAVAHAFRPQFAGGPAERRREKLTKAVEKFADDLMPG